MIQAKGTVTMDHVKYGWSLLNVFKFSLQHGVSTKNYFYGVKILRFKFMVGAV